jgi:riboflavin biosynthesis pyrimidine reductase
MSRPKVIVWQQASLDGRLAVSPDSLLLYGDERWTAIQGRGELDAFEWIKAYHGVGATLEGSGSFLRDGDELEPLPAYEAGPAPLFEDYLPGAVVERPGHRGWFIVVDGRGRGRGWIKDGAVFGEAWAGWHLLVFAGRHTPAAYLAYLRREEIPYLVAGPGEDNQRVDLELALQKLRTRLGVESVLSTAGGRLNGALLRAGLVDEVNVELLPAVIGGRETPALFSAPSLKAGEWPTRLELLTAQVQAGGRVWLRYRVTPWEEQTAAEAD